MRGTLRLRKVGPFYSCFQRWVSVLCKLHDCVLILKEENKKPEERYQVRSVAAIDENAGAFAVYISNTSSLQFVCPDRKECKQWLRALEAAERKPTPNKQHEELLPSRRWTTACLQQSFLSFPGSLLRSFKYSQTRNSLPRLKIRKFKLDGATFRLDRRYRSIHIVGSGVSGTVLGASDTVLGCKVSIKRLLLVGKLSSDRHVLREVRLGRLLRGHPAIAALRTVLRPSVMMGEDSEYTDREGNAAAAIARLRHLRAAGGGDGGVAAGGGGGDGGGGSGGASAAAATGAAVQHPAPPPLKQQQPPPPPSSPPSMACVYLVHDLMMCSLHTVFAQSNRAVLEAERRRAEGEVAAAAVAAAAILHPGDNGDDDASQHPPVPLHCHKEHLQQLRRGQQQQQQHRQGGQARTAFFPLAVAGATAAAGDGVQMVAAPPPRVPLEAAAAAAAASPNARPQLVATSPAFSAFASSACTGAGYDSTATSALTPMVQGSATTPTPVTFGSGGSPSARHLASRQQQSPAAAAGAGGGVAGTTGGSGGLLSLEQARCFIFQLLCGLRHLHADRRVMHRDIKPGNLLVGRNCELRICDFGLARDIPCSGDGDVDGANSGGGGGDKTTAVVAGEACKGGGFTHASDASQRWGAGEQKGELPDGESEHEGQTAVPPITVPPPPLSATAGSGSGGAGAGAGVVGSSGPLTTYICTRQYRAPEVVLGTGYGAAMDVWGAGLVLGQLLQCAAAVRCAPLFNASNYRGQLRNIVACLGQTEAEVAALRSSSGCDVSSSRARDFMAHLGVVPANDSEGALRELLGLPPAPSHHHTHGLLGGYGRGSGGCVVPSPALHLLRRLLTKDPRKRITAAQALQHPWLVDLTEVDTRRCRQQQQLQLQQQRRPQTPQRRHTFCLACPRDDQPAVSSADMCESGASLLLQVTCERAAAGDGEDRSSSAEYEEEQWLHSTLRADLLAEIATLAPLRAPSTAWCGPLRRHGGGERRRLLHNSAVAAAHW